MKNIIFVCTGNICRSQMAHMMLLNRLKKNNINNIKVDSAAITYEAVGNLIDPRAYKVLQKNNVPVIKHYAKKISTNDILNNDLIIAMTYSHYKALIDMSPKEKHNDIFMFNQFVYENKSPSYNIDIDDPWYGNIDDFFSVYLEIEKGFNNIIRKLKKV